jgi:hypothetical protein
VRGVLSIKGGYPVKHNFRRWTYVGLALVFLLAFVLRAVTPVSRPLQWYYRSVNFITAIVEGRWADTLFSEHPGASVMWIVGIAQHLVYNVRVALGQNPPPLLDIDGRVFTTEVAVGVWALAVVISGTIAAAWYPLRRLFGRRVAWASVLLMALDPYYIANGKVLHIDALLSALMLLSALTWLVYARDGDRRFFVVSVACGGLAVLTKAPSIFLIPFCALALLVTRFGEERFNLRWLLRRWALPLLVWLCIVIALFFLLYPAAWAIPGETFGFALREITYHVSQPHTNPVFFHGTAWVSDPGPLYYVYTLAFKSSWVSFSLALLGLLIFWRWPSVKRRSAMLVVVYVVCFAIQMMIGGKKGLRYLLPLFPMFDVLAGLGWLAFQKGIAILVRRSVISWAIAALPIVVLAAMVLPLHPYYGTHYNILWGGIRAATREFPLQEQAEGHDLVGEWLEERGGSQLRVVSQQPDMLMQHTGAQIFEYDAPEANPARHSVDYFTFDRNHLVRNYREDLWWTTWQRYRSREPAFQVDFLGVPYVWVYEALPSSLTVDAPDHLFGGRLDSDIELIGYDWQDEWIVPGTSIPLYLYWRTGQPLATDYTVFVHLHGPDGGLLAQCDSPPLGGTRPTTGWAPGEVVGDMCDVVLPEDAPQGQYQVFVGMYAWPSLERLPARAADGADLPDGRLPLLTFELRDEDASRLPWLWMVLAWLAALAMLGIGLAGMWKLKEEPGV